MTQVSNNPVVHTKLIQIFRYLQALNQLRNPIQREINDQPWKMWLHDLPEHPCIRRGVYLNTVGSDENDEGNSNDDFILKVSRPKLIDAPAPPKEIIAWLRNGWQQINGQVSVEPTQKRGEGSYALTISFNDDPQRPLLLEEWKRRRERWIDAEKPAYAAYDIFDKLYALLSQLDRESERLELMIGDGLLSWQSVGNIPIHHPLLLLRLQVRFNPDIPEITLFETGQSSELHTALLQGMQAVQASEIARCREDLETGNWHPLQGEETTRFLKRLVNRLSSNGEFIEPGATRQKKDAPYISRDPVLFLRPRTLGMTHALEAILEMLPQLQTFPYALTSLVGIEGDVHDRQDISTKVSMIDSPNGEDETILFSKPANAEQLEIARRLTKHPAVLVQGPPGTGKTHTIANLIGHLLAQGKSVLVTSEKPKALRVLREKVVEPLQPLCASILQDDSRKQMESTIDAISERLARSDADRLEREAVALTRQRLEILRQLRDARQKLIEARGGEYRAIVFAGETYTPSEAARWIQNNRETSKWIPGPLTPGALLPLTKQELVQLYHSNATISWKDEQELTQFLPESGNLLLPTDFEQIVGKQAQLLHGNLGFRSDLWSGGNQATSVQSLQEVQHRLIQEIEPLRDLIGWRLAAILAGREGGVHRQAWDDLLNQVEYAYHFSAQAQLFILKYDPMIPPDCLPERIEEVLSEIIEHLRRESKLSGFKLLTKRDWKAVIDRTRVNGRQPEVVEHFEALRYQVQLHTQRAQLVSRWQRQMATLGGPNPTTVGSQPEAFFHQFVDPLHQCLDWYTKIWQPLELDLKRQGFHWDAFLAEMPVQRHEYGDLLRLHTAVIEKLPVVIAAEVQRRVYAQHEATILELERNIEQMGVSVKQVEALSQLRAGVKGRDAQLYRRAYESLSELHVKRDILRLRYDVLLKMERVAPGWATAIRERLAHHGGSELPDNPEHAWLWRQLYEELDRRAKTSLEELQERIAQLQSELFRVTAELVEKKAWAQQVRHTTLTQRQALQGWRELMRKVGKGTGKRAPRLLEEARQLMPICQTAVPVWIMPISYVTRNFDMKRNHFDVVIIDEASQADITALTAVFMGSQVVVVGDDEQVSPMAVGQNLDTIQHLIDEYLKGIPLANIYDGKLSIYGLARTTFEPICLLEHFRCVAPIIQFSNELSYAGKIKPLRADSEVQRRPPTVAYAVKSFSKIGKVNEAEATIVASFLVAASQQPEYKDATFGVISLLGVDQALYIDTLLRRYMPPEDYIRGRVLCGDSAQFQGDERDVMFLSMVDVPGDKGGPLSLRAEEGHDDMFKKRFNVAASRARDQMWVVHSLDPDIDLKQDDIRRRLIIHARDQHIFNHARREQEQKIESEFERQVFDRLVQAGYRVITQWPVGAYRIDMVVEGNGKRLAVECDGDRWHPIEKLEEDMARQAILERLGWRFVRIRGSQYFRNPDMAMKPVLAKLQAAGIPANGMVTTSKENLDGKELKFRIIRVAQKLRDEWKDTGKHPAIQAGASLPQGKLLGPTNGASFPPAKMVEGANKQSNK